MKDHAAADSNYVAPRVATRSPRRSKEDRPLGIDARAGRALHWLRTEARALEDPLPVIDGLCVRLAEDGFPLAWLQCGFPTLHPQIAGCAFTWKRPTQAMETCVLHGDTGAHGPVHDLAAAAEPRRLGPDAVARLVPSAQLPERAERRDWIQLPLLFSGGRRHSLLVAGETGRKFSPTELTALDWIGGMVAPVLESLMTRRVARTLLETYVGPRAGGRILDGRIQRGDVEEIEAALWFSDLRDSTRLAETLSSVELLATLNAFFEHIAGAVTAHGGEVLRFVGDGMLVVFPSRGSGLTGACRRGAAAADDAVGGLAALNARAEVPATVRFGIGLHVGAAIYGNVGAPDRLDFTVHGPAVNRAARIESMTKRLGTPVLASAEFAALCGHRTRAIGRYQLEGITEAVTLYELLVPPAGELVS